MKVTIPLCVFIITIVGFIPVYAQWEPDVRLSNGTYHAYTSFNHQHSIATRGDTVHAVWFDGRHGWPNAEIYYRRSLDKGETWGSEMRLTDDTNWSGNPSLAVAGETVHIVYFESFDEDSDIHYMRSTDGGVTWSPDTQLTTNTSMQDFPSIAVQDSIVHIVFHDEKDGNWEVYYLRSTDNGITWDPEKRLTIDPDWSNNANILVRDQLVHVVWSDDRVSSTHFDIYYKRSTDHGSTWGADTRLTFTLDSGTPGLAMSGTNLFIAFQSERDGNTEMFFKRSTNNGIDWLPDVQLTDDPALRQIPAIAAADSNIHIVWQDYRSTALPEIYYKRSTDLGQTWQTDLRLTNDSLRSIWPGVAVGDSAVHVIWTDDRPGIYQIFYKRDPTGNPHGISEIASHVDIGSRLVLIAAPNPFVSYTTLRGHEQDMFTVYDATGTYAGSCRGDRIAEFLPKGVYFAQSIKHRGTIARIVKIK
jgi:hypothetical protein